MFYIFHGPDDFSAKEQLHTFKTTLGDPGMLDLNTTTLHGKTLTLSELIHHAGAIPFLAPYRLVIVSNYLSQFSKRSKEEKEALTQLATFLKDLPPTTHLIFLDNIELKKSHPILELGRLHKDCVHLFKVPDKRILPDWIAHRVKQKGATIEPQATNALIEVMGEDLQALNNELEKLSLYVNNQRAITLADVELLCPYTVDSETFAMANAIGRRDTHIALDQLHKRLEEGQHPLAILAGIVTQFRGLLEVKSMAASGLTPQQIAAAKGWRSDYAAKMRLREGNNFSLPRLIEIFNLLLATELAIKTGQLEQILALDLLISQLCEQS